MIVLMESFYSYFVESKVCLFSTLLIRSHTNRMFFMISCRSLLSFYQCLPLYLYVFLVSPYVFHLDTHLCFVKVGRFSCYYYNDLSVGSELPESSTFSVYILLSCFSLIFMYLKIWQHSKNMKSPSLWLWLNSIWLCSRYV